MEIPRNILYYILIVAMLSVFFECADVQQTNDISCKGNGHIQIRTPAEIKSVASNCSNVTKIVNVPNNKTVIVDHCPLNQNVSILMYNVSDGAVTLQPVAIVVMCNGTGLKVNTSLIHNAASFKLVTVTYKENLTMGVIDKSTTKVVTTIKVGGSYTLQINSTDELTIHVRSCIASSGVHGTEEVQLYHQLENGTYIKEIGVFQGDFVETQLKRASIDMTGFRFVGKDTVVIKCTVDVSTPTTTTTTTATTTPASAQTSAPGAPQGRKRRNAFQEKHTQNLAVSTSLRVESHYESANGVKGMGGNGGRCMWIASILLVKYSLRWF